MTRPIGTAVRALLVVAGAAAVAGTAACVSMFEVPVETPIAAKLDVSAFQRVLLPGFLAGGTNDIDANAETVRLLRSQLRTKSQLKVIDADVVSLADVVDKDRAASGPMPVAPVAPAADAASQGAGQAAAQPQAAGSTSASGSQPKVLTDKDLPNYEQIFANVDYWKKLGEEYQGPLIVTGEVMFTPIEKSGFVEKPNESMDQYGRQVVTTVRQWMDRKGFSLTQKIIFIDGRTGAQLYTADYSDETLYASTENTPALSAYFELMDKRIPDFLNTLSSQKIKGTRILIK